MDNTTNQPPQTKGERGVYRRNTGIFLLVLGGLMAATDGFKFYDTQDMIVWAVLSTGAVLLGVGNVTDIWKLKK